MTNNILFWTCWGIEFVFMLWWLFDDMKLTYIKLNPFIYIGFMWLMVALVIRLALGMKGISLTMVSITAVPLAIMGAFLLVVMLASLSGKPMRWN
jgi:hypothetical protein